MALKELESLDSLIELGYSIIGDQRNDASEFMNKLQQALEYDQKPEKLKIPDDHLFLNTFSFNDYVEQFEEFRRWYEAQRYLAGGYQKKIKKITFSWKLYVLAVYSFEYANNHDFRWLNFSLKLIDDIFNEIDINNHANVLLPYYKAVLKSTIDEIRSLYEQA